MKRLIVLLVVLVVLAAIVFLVEKPRIEEERAVSEGKVTAAHIFPELKTDAITRIDISDGVILRKLSKKESDWFVAEEGKEEHKADKKKVEDLLDTLSHDFKEDQLASSSKDKQKTFEVEPDSGTAVSLYSGGEKPEVMFYIGKQGPDFTSTFVRKDGDDRTWLIARRLSEVFGFDTNGWRDKHLWSFDPSLVVEAEFKDGENLFHVKKGEKGWELIAPETCPANGVKIEAELKSLSELEATGFSDSTMEEAGPKRFAGSATQPSLLSRLPRFRR